MQGGRTEVTTTRVVWKLAAPANWVEVAKVFAQIELVIPRENRYDDVVELECHDDEIWVTYDKKWEVRA